MQVAGIIPSASFSYLPSIDVLGVYPTWQTTLLQVALLIVAVAFLLRRRWLRSRRTAALQAKRQLKQRFPGTDPLLIEYADGSFTITLPVPECIQCSTFSKGVTIFTAQMRMRREDSVSVVRLTWTARPSTWTTSTQASTIRFL